MKFLGTKTFKRPREIKKEHHCRTGAYCTAADVVVLRVEGSLVRSVASDAFNANFYFIFFPPMIGLVGFSSSAPLPPIFHYDWLVDPTGVAQQPDL